MENKDLEKIRHFKGSVADFKNYFDERAGENTNAYDTPDYQGFNNVHPTRGKTESPHWSEVSEDKDTVNEKVKVFMKNILSKMIPAGFGAYTDAKMREELKDAVAKAIEPILLKYDYIVEDTDVGHTDNEPGMLANDLSVIERYAKELGEMVKELESSNDEVDFPHWWQSKIILAKEYLVKAKHYLRAETEKESTDADPTQGEIPTFENYKVK